MSQDNAKEFLLRIRQAAELLDMTRAIGDDSKSFDQIVSEMTAVSKQLGLACSEKQMLAAIEADHNSERALKSALISKLNVRVPGGKGSGSEIEMFPKAIITAWPHPRA